jgi:hypothetical protein
MNTNVHIERLILDGLSVASGQGDLVQAAVETELTRLLAEHGLGLSSAGAVPHLSAEPIQLTRGSKPASLGNQIAQAIYRSLTLATASPRETRFHGGRKR